MLGVPVSFTLTIVMIGGSTLEGFSISSSCKYGSNASLTRKKKRRNIYTKGEVNRLIDSLVHPLLDQDPAFNIIDLILHSLVEQDPSETALKFLRYSLPQIIAEYASGPETSVLREKALKEIEASP